MDDGSDWSGNVQRSILRARENVAERNGRADGLTAVEEALLNASGKFANKTSSRPDAHEFREAQATTGSKAVPLSTARTEDTGLMTTGLINQGPVSGALIRGSLGPTVPSSRPLHGPALGTVDNV